MANSSALAIHMAPYSIAQQAFKYLALALALSCASLAHAAGTSRATDTAPRASEIEWIDFSDYNPTQVATGQNFTIDLLDGRTLRFHLQHTFSDPAHGATTSPVGFVGASFGRTNPGYQGIAGSSILYGHSNGTVEISNIQVSDADGNLYAFEWVAADAESTAHVGAGARREFIEFESNGSTWSQIASLNRPDGTGNPGTLSIAGAPSVARIGVVTPAPEGGAFVVGTAQPTRVRFSYGSSDGSATARQGAAFGVVPRPTIIGTVNVPANHPLALLLGALALGWLAKRKLRAV